MLEAKGCSRIWEAICAVNRLLVLFVAILHTLSFMFKYHKVSYHVRYNKYQQILDYQELYMAQEGDGFYMQVGQCLLLD